MLSRQIDAANSKLEAMYAERLGLFQALSDDGVKQSEIADLAGQRDDGEQRITANAVAFALHKARHASTNGAS